MKQTIYNTETTEEQEKNRKARQEEEQRANMGIAVGATVGGALLAKSQFDRGNITGRERLYHQTDKKNVGAILNEGIKASHAKDPNNITNNSWIGQQYKIQGKELPSYTYFGRKKIILNTPKTQEAVNRRDIKAFLREQGNRTHLKVKAPVWKMQAVQNPETAGVNKKSPTRGMDFYRKMNGPAAFDPAINARYTKAFDLLDKRTVTINGDMPSKYIKNSRNYERATLKEVKDFIKNNPRRFAKGALVATAGIGAATAGGIYLAKQLKKKREQEKNNKEERKQNED